MDRFIMDGRYGSLLSAVGLPLREILIKSELPQDLFSRKNIRLSQKEYFRLMENIGESISNEETPIKIATSENIETFSPAIFAAFCSKNAQICIERLAQYKKLIGPMVFIIMKNENSITVKITTEDPVDKIPSFLEITEITFLINLIRKATKEKIIPLRITLQNSINNMELERYWGCKPEKSCKSTLTLSLSDSLKPFVSENKIMWDYFEPELKRRLSELQTDDSFGARVRSALVELLPMGCSSIEEVSLKLAVSKRTLQRKLTEEKTTFQKQLNHTRELLAKNYIKNTNMTSDDIAFLLGYKDLNSFLRAFQVWCGMSISEYKKSLQNKV
ncbi:transcriptional regulator, AraC family [Clostridium bornimense]|uniref:Transcriptional regulator, AraC family n=1 Tax=Clostridium bornimense TaxID=1216932 RepID=W6RVL0_9CLOT|nr:AraC family transcriptional regulator [Clostridium bornimense]CDM67644.1 transcriptional regulator, AraC family [Clostridium bornimense]